MNIKGKMVLITGGGSGIGAAIAKRFVEDGARVCITGRRERLLDEVAQSLPAGKVVICSGDVSKEEDANRMVEIAIKFGGKLDVLINNAGINLQGSVTELDLSVWQRAIGVNVTGPYLLMKAAIPHMIGNGGGSIINIASIGGINCLPGMPSYCVSKAALIMLTKQVAMDYGNRNIRCNVICPGGVKTDMIDSEFGKFGKMLNMSNDSFFHMLSSEIPLRRFADASEITGICSHLASDDSSFMTGAVIVVDGGTSVVSVVGAAIKAALKREGIDS